MKFHDHGLDIIKELVNDNIVSVVDYEAIFGKKKRSNGFKLDIYCDLMWLQEFRNYMKLFIERRNH